jgi:imidazoleglycerol-phosphate dehydratase
MNRTAQITRTTAETAIDITLDLDGSGRTDIATGIGFFDHMLTAFGRHATFDLSVRATGDVHIDAHHTIEDVGIVLGQALRTALGDKVGITRFGQSLLPMDEACVQAGIDLSGRGFLVFEVAFERPMLGTMDTQLVEEFFRALSANGAFALHLYQRAGSNAHHVAEATFKAAARAARIGFARFAQCAGALTTTKGSL